VRTSDSLARELGMAAIAEGVETEAQKDQLRNLDWQFSQGYLIAKPMAGESVTRLLETNPVIELRKSP
jgi:EAL domain-containing protein (putative c-di-GMP-specific phosphodiesterase class I)